MANKNYAIVNKSEDIPTCEHWAVLEDESIRYDDGYGSQCSPSYSTMNYFTYIAFFTDAALHEWIKKKELNRARSPYKVIRVQPATVSTEVSVTIRT